MANAYDAVKEGRPRAFEAWRPVDEAIIAAMARTGATVAQMADRLGRTEAEVAEYVERAGRSAQ